MMQLSYLNLNQQVSGKINIMNNYASFIIILCLVIASILNILTARRERMFAKAWEEQAMRALNTIKELEDIINSKQK